MANNTAVPAAKKKSVLDRLGGQKFIVVMVILVLCAFFSIKSPNFRKYTTIVSILDYSYYIALMAIGVTFPLITGGVDLSIGTGLICYSLIGGYLVSFKGAPVIVGIIVTILIGVLFGIINGALIANIVYMYDYPRIWFHRCWWFWYFLAYSNNSGRSIP